MKFTKLDEYDSMVIPGIIRIDLDSSNDARAVDILSELSRTDNQIYLDGSYYQFLGHSRIVGGVSKAYLELQVVMNQNIF